MRFGAFHANKTIAAAGVTGYFSYHTTKSALREDSPPILLGVLHFDEAQTHLMPDAAAGRGGRALTAKAGPRVFGASCSLHVSTGSCLPSARVSAITRSRSSPAPGTRTRHVGFSRRRPAQPASRWTSSVSAAAKAAATWSFVISFGFAFRARPIATLSVTRPHMR